LELARRSRAIALLKNSGTREGVANLALQLGFDGPFLSLDSARARSMSHGLAIQAVLLLCDNERVQRLQLD
jgi:hypothetical protein